MTQRKIPAVFMRGGTSKGLFFRADDLPADRSTWHRIFLDAMGSPDSYGRQLNGMGGGVSSLSKAVVLSQSAHDGIDIDYDFYQVDVASAVVDTSTTCGNLSSAVGPFAVDAGLVPAQGDVTPVRIRSVNTGKNYIAHVPTAEGCFDENGGFAIPGVSGTGSKIRLDYIDPGGATTGRLLPTGNAVDVISLPGDGDFEVSLVDASTASVIVAAERLGLDGTETVDALEADRGLMARLDVLRRHGAVKMGLARTPADAALGNPRVAIVAPTRPYRTLSGETVETGDAHIAARITSMGQIHRVLPLTGAMCLAVACRITGTVSQRIAGDVDGELLLANPSGVLPVDAAVTQGNGPWSANTVTVYRTARALMEGSVLVPD